MAIGISKSGLEKHYAHVQRIRKEHGAIPVQAVREIGNRTLREAKMLANERAFYKGFYQRDLNMQMYRDGKNDVAVIGSHMEYAPHIEYGTKPHPIGHAVKIGGVGWRFIGLSKNGKGKIHPGTKARWVLRDAIFNLAQFHVPIIMKYLSKPSKP